MLLFKCYVRYISCMLIGSPSWGRRANEKFCINNARGNTQVSRLVARIAFSTSIAHPRIRFILYLLHWQHLLRPSTSYNQTNAPASTTNSRMADSHWAPTTTTALKFTTRRCLSHYLTGNSIKFGYDPCCARAGRWRHQRGSRQTCSVRIVGIRVWRYSLLHSLQI